MKKLLLKSMLLVSHVEKKALKLKFDPDITLIQGDNDTGKSSVIKTLLSTFGAEPPKIHRNWKAADIGSLVHFKLDEESYSIYRYRGAFSLFSEEGQLIGSYESVTNELAPALAKLFGFNLKITNRQGLQETPPPAYMLLPFYLDQDKGWSGTWCSFNKLGQYANWKQTLTSYFLGLRPDEWYALNARIKILEQEKQEPLRQLKSIESIELKTIKELSSVDFNIDLDEFKKDIERLVSKCNELQKKQAQYKHRISETRTEEIRLEAQIEIVAHTRDELNADYSYVQSNLEKLVDCPTCGAEYENSFTERFAIAQDAETCTDLLASLREDLTRTKKETISIRAELENASFTKRSIDKILAQKRGKLKIKDVIDIEGKKSLMNHLKKEAEDIKIHLGEVELSQAVLKESADKFDDADRRKEIVREYGERFEKNARKLHVTGLSDQVFKNVNASIDESGSDLPRGVLAYFFSVASLVIEGSGNLNFPLVIDAPNQQEQDQGNLSNILNFIVSNKPNKSQLILGLVDDANIEFPGSRIQFKTKHEVLDSTKYATYAKEIRHYELAHMSGNSELD
ncbi:hypothetical protein BDK62_103107 [Halomonas alkaliantarctica]|nr:hypothetical protein BDK62_103107 [Halomonas alkaliantarctica]